MWSNNGIWSFGNLTHVLVMTIFPICIELVTKRKTPLMRLDTSTNMYIFATNWGGGGGKKKKLTKLRYFHVCDIWPWRVTLALRQDQKAHVIICHLLYCYFVPLTFTCDLQRQSRSISLWSSDLAPDVVWNSYDVCGFNRIWDMEYCLEKTYLTHRLIALFIKIKYKSTKGISKRHIEFHFDRTLREPRSSVRKLTKKDEEKWILRHCDLDLQPKVINFNIVRTSAVSNHLSKIASKTVHPFGINFCSQTHTHRQTEVKV